MIGYENQAYQKIEESFNPVTASNMAQASALQIRLSTDPLIEKIEMYLRGETLATYIDPKTGRRWETREIKSLPVCNEMGVHGILNWIQLLINTQTVQGNYTRQWYLDFCYYARKSLARCLLDNRILWEITPKKLRMISDSIMNIVDPYFSRLINDGERQSYINTLRHIESQTLREEKPKPKFSILGRGQNVE